MSQKRSASPMMDDIHKKRGRPPNSTRIAAALQTTMNLSNIDIDLPDIPRPFKVVNTLPLSEQEPVYDESFGSNLLSVKDSATLYNSLIISRQNWLYNDEMGVFKQYWSRREDAIEKAMQEQENQTPIEGDDAEVSFHHEGTSKRKNMNKLCECSLQLGPHSFDIRLFIVKNDKIEKKFSDDQKEEEEKTGIKVKAEDEDNDESDKEDENEEKEANESDDANETPEPETKGREESNSAELKSETKDEEQSKNTETVSESKDDQQTKSTELESESKDEQQAKVSETKSEVKDEDQVKITEPKSESHVAAPTKTADAKQEPEKPGSLKTPKPKSQTKPKPSKELKFASQSKDASTKKMGTSGDTKGQTLAETKPAKREIQQSLENHIMIANLNSLARTNTSLNDLMKTVASGNANTKQIAEFQKYITQAKDMGDPTGNHAKTYHAQIKQQKADAKAAEKKLRNEEKERAAAERRKLKEAKREAKRIEKEKEKELKQEAKARKRALRQKQREVTQDKKKKDPSFKINKTKLTALQERYLENATLAFEFSENSSARYLLPKNCIMERLENGTLLMSFVIVHNHQEIADFEQDEKEEEAKSASADEVKTEAEPSVEELEQTKRPSRRKKGRYGNVRKASVKVVKEPEPIPKPVRPQPVYSTMTIKLLEVPPHCHELILNSADPLEEVQEKMNKIFDDGQRQEVNYVWYQLDGINDEIQAEILRSNLKTLEAQNVKRAGGTGRRKATE